MPINRSEFRRFYDAHIMVPPYNKGSASIWNVVNPGSGKLMRCKSLWVKWLFSEPASQAWVAGGFYGFIRYPAGETLSASEILDHDPRVIGSKPFVIGGGAPIIYEAYLKAINVDDTDKLYFFIKAEGVNGSAEAANRIVCSFKMAATEVNY